MDKDQAYAQLIRRIKDYAILNSCASVLGWDERAYMPRDRSSHRAEQMALLARMDHEMLTDPEIGESMLVSMLLPGNPLPRSSVSSARFRRATHFRTGRRAGASGK